MKKNPTFMWNTNSGTAEFRIMCPVKALRKTGRIIAVNPIDPDQPEGMSPWERELQDQEGMFWKEREREMRDLLDNSSIFIMENVHSHAGASVCNWIRGEFRVPLVITTDDYFLGVDPSHSAYPVYAIGRDVPKWMGYAMTHAHAIITSTDYLSMLYKNSIEKWSRDFGRGGNIPFYTLGNYVNPKDWRLKITEIVFPKSRHKVRILFEGGHAHHENMKLIEKPLHKLLVDMKDKVELVIAGSVDERRFSWGKLPNVMKHKGVNIDKFPQFLFDLRPDINLAPMIDSVFMRAKTNLRFLIGSMLKIPTIASDILPYKECHDYGIVCPEPEDWYGELKMLVEDEATRKRIGNKAYRYVAKNYNMKRCAEDYARVITAIERRYYWGQVGLGGLASIVNKLKGV